MNDAHEKEIRMIKLPEVCRECDADLTDGPFTRMRRVGDPITGDALYWECPDCKAPWQLWPGHNVLGSKAAA